MLKLCYSPCSGHLTRPFSYQIVFLVHTNGMEDHKITFENKIILAPMVRVGTLPMRLLALEYGADLVYSEELVDLKLIKCFRTVNRVLQTVDFIDPSDGSVIFRTCDREKNKVILQLGTSCEKRAVLVGKLVQNDVAALDINMGCPKEFSVKGGMGVALLSQQEKAMAILKSLVEHLKIPITCKIRILPTIEETIEIVKKFASAGVAAVAIHARMKDERPQHDPHPDFIKAVVKAVRIPIIANGGSKEIEKHSDIIKFRNKCAANSVMIARAAQNNVSIFKPDGVLLPVDDVIIRYLRICVDFDNTASNTKYCVQSMIKDQQETARGRLFLNCQTLHQICSIWNLGDYCYEKQLEFQKKGNFGRRDVTPGFIPNDVIKEPETKKSKVIDICDEDIFERNVAFYRSNYIKDPDLPKSILHNYAKKNNIPMPIYETFQKDKLFRTKLKYNGKRYASTFWEKNKKYAEQGAALVCILFIGLVSEESLIKNGSILK
ncbi:tRNA-dihydrouridine(20) synthase [NAD(P)+]-like [Condylostylus longicornis]|uniref:tRNA-dihydrouridine(20) synthase [NAD(P)+]-like n=1 Tax=Condylostylus longicornis TaxID=2530218 RepID=UPI00244E427C|nr:tRNA-dihydrouridine(20) synthase [NAD(P)+]-like [Condylostylus longicornis]